MKTVKYNCDWCGTEIPNGPWELNFEKASESRNPSGKIELCDSCASKVYIELGTLKTKVRQDNSERLPVYYEVLKDGIDTVLKYVPAPVDWGHGHVYPRKDGALARCGGPGLCDECSRDKERLEQEIARNSS